MSRGIDYAIKYKALKAKFISSVQQAFEMGYEKGYSEAGQDQMQQQMAQQQAEAQAQQGQQMMDENGQPIGPDDQMPGAGNGAPGQDQDQPPGQPGPQDMAQQADMAHMQQGSTELDSKLGELEDLVNKSEKGLVKSADLKAIMSSLKPSLRKISEAQTSMSLRKSLTPRQQMGRANKAVKKFSTSYQANMSQDQKSSLSLQEKIVSDIMKSWAGEESEILKSITETLGVDGKVK